ncbi:MAG: hypothetical protein PVH84_13720, partial [Candidatus Aminicenantes bacterium]
DWLLGGSGDDTATFEGAYDNYRIIKNKKYVVVEDTRVNRDGSDTLIDIEYLQFKDKKLKL